MSLRGEIPRKTRGGEAIYIFKIEIVVSQHTPRNENGDKSIIERLPQTPR